MCVLFFYKVVECIGFVNFEWFWVLDNVIVVVVVVIFVVDFFVYDGKKVWEFGFVVWVVYVEGFGVVDEWFDVVCYCVCWLLWSCWNNE